MREFTVFTHRVPEETQDTLVRLATQAERAAVRLRLDQEETRKHDLVAGPSVELNAEVKDSVELCVALGGDGTILRALQCYAGTGVPVFGFNFGTVGFLATVERAESEDGIRRALSGDFELLQLPAIVIGGGAQAARERRFKDGVQTALNDVAIHRKVGERVADLAYALEGVEIGRVRCDGLVVATAAGSTGYNLANGGPVMAWGVEGYVVSFIAPHSLTARALVAAPGDLLTIHNLSPEPLDIAVDGRPAGEIAAGGSLEASFVDDVGTLAQLPGSSFYRRLKEKFGRLAS
jgi:NAD+ kinase